MKNYEITDMRFIKFVGNKRVFAVTIIADTEADVPEPQEEWGPGSICQVAETHTYKVLNNERRWV